MNCCTSSWRARSVIAVSVGVVVDAFASCADAMPARVVAHGRRPSGAPPVRCVVFVSFSCRFRVACVLLACFLRAARRQLAESSSPKMRCAR
ncbi:hypothetical protein BMA10399_A0636 [Burkholderia mallei ATCC 10399]|nr:hypothetical protein BMA10399_A0636 [Burkholderia mallei ATCC 10399]